MVAARRREDGCLAVGQVNRHRKAPRRLRPPWHPPARGAIVLAHPRGPVRMSDSLSRRAWLKAVGAAGAAGAAPVENSLRSGVSRSLPILPLVSTSEVFIPGRGRGFQKFSFDFPEPSVEFAGLRFGFLVFTRENVYGL